MNSNNWLSFPLSPTHLSLPPHLHTAQKSHNFSLGLVHDNMDTPFPNQEWNLIGEQGNNDQVPKVADFLGVSKSENSSNLVAYNDIQGNDTDYLFTSSSLLPQVQNTLSATPTSYELPENASTLQSFTLSMGSGKRSTCETSTGENSSNDNNIGDSILADSGTEQLEFITLSQRIEDPKTVCNLSWVKFNPYVTQVNEAALNKDLDKSLETDSGGATMAGGATTMDGGAAVTGGVVVRNGVKQHN
ncbi:hypothetical protein Ccrd_000943 [Cynara cardunculus var. scolymus]|uniref:Uncharacterized protein n=1 Tax=Cynara cardunculus var. scolymus TaxID=59895 RepID=A0A103XU63_CYNCS|nr:hypothetical protein Ccrd_000943 [Cynara cardunculus var. scolymus]